MSNKKGNRPDCNLKTGGQRLSRGNLDLKLGGFPYQGSPQKTFVPTLSRLASNGTF